LGRALADKQWSKVRLAKEAGINKNTLHNFWKDYAKYHPRADYVFKIAEALDTTAEYLMTGKEREVKEVVTDPVKQELIDHIKTIDHDTAVEIRAMIKTMQMMTLKKESRRSESA